MSFLHPIEQVKEAEQLAEAALQAPLNNLVIVVALVSLVIILGIGFLIWRFLPMIIKQIQHQLDTNEHLTIIVGQNVEQIKLTTQAVTSNTTEVQKVIVSIDRQTDVIKIQGRDLRNYQTLVSDNLSAHTEQIAANTRSIETMREQIEVKFTELSSQIETISEDKAVCAGHEALLRQLRNDVIDTIKQQQVNHSVAAIDGG
jgi:uncharacterized membrane-anchored protein YhcB (DUF1043 family)